MSVMRQWFVRTYEAGGTTFTCGCFCDIKGNGIETRDEFDTDEIDCPSCLVILRQFSL
jgi:hypothetical protein